MPFGYRRKILGTQQVSIFKRGSRAHHEAFQLYNVELSKKARNKFRTFKMAHKEIQSEHALRADDAQESGRDRRGALREPRSLHVLLSVRFL